MKLRLGLILLLFAASAGILAWMYYAATREPRSPKGSPWAETLADLDACCRRKHVKSVQYDHFAGIAADEERHTAERLFRAMAFSERLQENNCATAILHLGGHYTPPGKIIIFGGTTDGNLERSVAYERQAHAGRSGADIRRAMERGNRYAARILTWASAGDMRNIALLERCRQEGRNAPDKQYKNEIEESYVYDFLMNLFIKFPFLKIGEYMNQNQEGQEYRAATSFIEEKIKKDKIDLEKMREIMDSLEEIKDWDTDDVIFKWIDNLELEEEEKEIQ